MTDHVQAPPQGIQFSPEEVAAAQRSIMSNTIYRSYFGDSPVQAFGFANSALKAVQRFPAGSEQEEEDRLQAEDAAANLRLIDCIADTIGLPKDEELSRHNFAAWLQQRSQPAIPAGSAEPDYGLRNRIQEILLASTCFGKDVCQFPPCGCATYLADEIIGRHSQPGNVSVPLEALRNCGCPSDTRTSVGQCTDSGTCGCSLALERRVESEPTLPEELEELIGDKSAFRAADLLLSKFNITRKA